MNKIIKLFIVAAMVFAAQINAQNSFRVGELNPYFSEFLKPMTTGLAVGMGQGWVHTVKPHKTLGFDIKFSAAVVQIPTSVANFSGDALSSMSGNGYVLQQNGSNLAMADAEIPTIISADAASNLALQKTIGGSGGMSVDIPLIDGLDIPYAGNVALQLSVGLPKGTEVMGRFIPDMSDRVNNAANISQASVSELNMWGIGVKHDLKQWIPVISRIPIVQFSGMLAYSEFNVGIQAQGLDLNPSSMLDGSVNINYIGEAGMAGAWNEQGFDLKMQSLTGALLAGLNIPIVKPYIGVGFNRASVSTGLTGRLPDIEYVDANNVNVSVDEEGLRLENKETFVNLQAGINIKLAIINIHAQYTLQEYSMISGGISIGLR